MCVWGAETLGPEVRSTLVTLGSAIKGLVVMSAALEVGLGDWLSHIFGILVPCKQMGFMCIFVRPFVHIYILYKMDLMLMLLL